MKLRMVVYATGTPDRVEWFATGEWHPVWTFMVPSLIRLALRDGQLVAQARHLVPGMAGQEVEVWEDIATVVEGDGA